MSSQLYKNCRILTIEFWNFVKEFMPVAKSTGRPGIPAYIVLDAILWIADNGAKWRSLPYEEYGNWNSFYKLFRAWIDKGIFKAIFEKSVQMQKKSATLSIDSTSCKVHQDGTGARKDAKGYETNQDIGISRGGRNTKIHAIVNESVCVVSLLLTPGNIHDSKPSIELALQIDLKDVIMLADKAYNTQLFRNVLQNLGVVLNSPDKVNALHKHLFSFEAYKKRNVVERFFQRIKKFRKIATRYEKLSVCFLAFVMLCAAVVNVMHTIT